MRSMVSYQLNNWSTFPANQLDKSVSVDRCMKRSAENRTKTYQPNVLYSVKYDCMPTVAVTPVTPETVYPVRGSATSPELALLGWAFGSDAQKLAATAIAFTMAVVSTI